MNKTLRTVLLILGAVVLAYVWGWCQFKRGQSDVELRSSGDSTDLVRGRLLGEIVALEFQIKVDSARHAAEMRNANNIVVVTRRHSDSLLAALPPQLAEVQEVLDAQTATIKSLDYQHHTDSLALLFWQATALTRAEQRDSAMSVATLYRNQRDAWQRKASPSLVTRLVREAPWIAGAYLIGKFGP